MAECHRLQGCPFFRDALDEMPALAEMYKDRYCREDNSDCAREYLYRFLESKNYDIDDQTEEEIERLSHRLCPNQLDVVTKRFPLGNA